MDRTIMWIALFLTQVSLSAKVNVPLKNLIKNVVEDNPTIFKDQSDFVRIACYKLLRDMNIIGKDREQVLRATPPVLGPIEEKAIDETFLVDSDLTHEGPREGERDRDAR